MCVVLISQRFSSCDIVQRRIGSTVRNAMLQRLSLNLIDYMSSYRFHTFFLSCRSNTFWYIAVRQGRAHSTVAKAEPIGSFLPATMFGLTAGSLGASRRLLETCLHQGCVIPLHGASFCPDRSFQWPAVHAPLRCRLQPSPLRLGLPRHKHSRIHRGDDHQDTQDN